MDEEQRPKSGSVPNAFGNALAHRWAPELPRQLTGGFLTTLYVLRAMASADGRLRFERDGAAITIQQIARACRSDQKDVRTFLEAAVAAGVVASHKAPGRATLYRLVVCPWPDWQAAAGVVWVAQQVKAEQRAARAEKKAAAEQAAASTAPAAPEGSGDSHPTSTGQGSGDSPPRGVGGQSPADLGGQCPDHPCSTHELPHDMVAVGPQAEAARVPEEDPPAAAPQPPRLVPPQPGGDRPKGRTAKDSSCQGQRALLLSVNTPPDGAEDPAQPPAHPPAEPTDDDIRHALRALGSGAAMTLYGPNRVWPVLALLNDPNSPRTGT